MDLRRATLALVAVAGLVIAAACTAYLLQDWRELRAADAAYRSLVESLPEVRDLLIAESREKSHRLNCLAEGLGALLGLLIAAIGLHGLCLLPPRCKPSD